jgi:hypothetical protein
MNNPWNWKERALFVVVFLAAMILGFALLEMAQ